MRIVETMTEARAAASGTVGLVPTMGYFHEGHLSLMDHSVESDDTTLVSLFVNPLQFDQATDLDAYPRDTERDAALAEAVGVDLLVIPAVPEMYPVDPVTRVHVAGISDAMEGAHRPGHFDGVATIVAKLFAGLQPDRAYFGRKDAQQLALVRRMALDLSFPVDVVGMPLVRDHDGLALSSRNVRLGAHRTEALGISRALMAAADAAEQAGTNGAADLAEVVRTAAPEIDFEYINLAETATMQPAPWVPATGAVLAVAAKVGPVRLIDNIGLTEDDAGRIRADRGVPLAEPSTLLEGR